MPRHILTVEERGRAVEARRRHAVSVPIESVSPTVVEVPTTTITRRRNKPDQITANFKRDRSRYYFVPLGNIRVDPTYQRKLQQKKIVQMAHNWNPEKFGAVVLSRRPDNYFYVLDGQHRIEALNLIENRPAEVWAQVFTGLTLEEEAQLFHDLDSERDNLTPGASFKALVAANDSTAASIQRAARNVGMTADYDRGAVAGNVRAFETLKGIHRRQGEAGLERILRICHTAWPDNNNATVAPLLRGLETFLVAYGDRVDDRRVIEVLRRVEPTYVVNTGRQLNGTLTSAIQESVAMAIRMLYNKKLAPARRLSESVFV